MVLCPQLYRLSWLTQPQGQEGQAPFPPAGPSSAPARDAACSMAAHWPCAPHPSHLSSSGYVHHGVFLMGLAGVNAARALDVSSAGRTSVIFCKKKTQNTEKNPIRLKAPKLEMWKFLKKIFEKKKKRYQFCQPKHLSYNFKAFHFLNILNIFKYVQFTCFKATRNLS